ncbi:endonuclease/exonuclease/phosphatase family protein [Prauserella sp. PE36]|uniref:endonuclease/exonuclease/phosphatase family protein n=1 Tax=Prauserella sp. PE36 TaxID=1504709 RepID=UPI0018F578AC|nr:endonuclease/exonuclease/phosphatase family protein [Prauserella sp. PE36]
MIAIGTWNLENLFKPGGEAGPRTQDAYEAKLAALADTIRSLEPDVLAVQEVGDPEALRELAARVGGDWEIELAEPDARGIRVGFLSRLPLTDREEVARFPEKLAAVQVDDDGRTTGRMGRPALKAVVRAGGLDVTLVSCHLKSKLLTFPGGRFSPRDEDERARFAVYALGRRAAEAATVRGFATRLLDGEGQQRALAVLGDLNDEQYAATTTLLQGPPGSELHTPGFGRSDRGDGARLWNLAPLIEEKHRFSRTYQGRRELIDHVLVSHRLVGSVSAVLTGEGGDSVTDDPADRRDAPGSDHRPVLARLDLG